MSRNPELKRLAEHGRIFRFFYVWHGSAGEKVLRTADYVMRCPCGQIIGFSQWHPIDEQICHRCEFQEMALHSSVREREPHMSYNTLANSYGRYFFEKGLPPGI